MTSEQQAETQLKNKTRMKDCRDSLTPDQKAEAHLKDKTRKKKFRKPANIDIALDKFKQHIKEFAEYVCICCNRRLYRKSVSEVKDRMFVDTVGKLKQMCLSGKTSVDEKEWLCKICQRYLKKDAFPSQANGNNLALPESHPEVYV